MKLYELSYLISPKLTEGEVEDFSRKIINFIQEGEGILAEIKSPIKKRLAFPIKKEGEGYLISLTFFSEPERLNNLEKRLTLEDKILRYIILSKKIPKKEAFKELPKIEKLETFVPSPGRGKPKKEKVELEEIEKKLEEILGE